MDTSNVDTVIVAGRMLKRAGRLVGVDVERVRRDAELSRDRVLAQAGWPRTVLGGYCPATERKKKAPGFEPGARYSYG